MDLKENVIIAKKGGLKEKDDKDDVCKHDECVKQNVKEGSNDYTRN